jgi:hypothetical protein
MIASNMKAAAGERPQFLVNKSHSLSRLGAEATPTQASHGNDTMQSRGESSLAGVEKLLKKLRGKFGGLAHGFHHAALVH